MTKQARLSGILLLISCLTISSPRLYAQNKPPTQKDLQAALQQAQQMLNDPATKKLMDSMGIKMPHLTTTPKATNKQLADAWEQENNIVPKKDAARLAAIPATPNTDGLKAYLQKVAAAVQTKMQAAQLANGQQILKEAQDNAGNSPNHAAIGMWIAGKPWEALYLIANAAVDNTSDANTLNNCAAMLSMAGAPHIAIPLLRYLNQQYPHNSTVLNNLGQAWLALGEAALADKYLDSALQIFPAHVQAHLAKAKIAESKGNTAKAAEHMEQAMQESYSAEKENALRKYGKKASGKNIKLPGTMPADPLGLEKFNWPAYPSTVKESLPLAEEWQRFKEAISKERSQLQLQQQMARKAAEERSAHFMKEAAANAGNPAFDATQLAPPFAQAAALKLKYYLDDDYGGLNKSMIRAQNQLLEVRKQVAALGMQRDSIYKALSKKYEPLIGDGRPNPLDEYCQEHTEATNQFLKAANTLLMQAQASYLEVVRKQINNMVYYSQYTNWPEHFEAIKAGAKADWLNQIASQRVEFGELGPFCKQEKEHNSAHANLSNFDDVACQYHSTLDLVVFEITASCSRLFGKLKLGNVEYTRKVDMDQDKLLAATLEISAGRSIGASKGPVAGEAKAEIKGRLEWNDTRVTNWTVEASAGVSVGSNLGVGDKSIDIAGVTAQIGMNSGPSLQGSGMLRSIQVK